MIRVKLLGCFLIGLSCAVSAVALDDDMHGHHHEATEKLGKVSFPISCAAGSQAEFERGVALLHSFGYEEAGDQFSDVAKKDPACAMAHWGIAMSLFHQIWERPEDATLKHGHEEIETAEKIGAKIREAQIEKVPYMLVVGDREQQNDQVAVRNRKHGDQGVKTVAEFLAEARKLIASKAVSE